MRQQLDGFVLATVDAKAVEPTTYNSTALAGNEISGFNHGGRKVVLANPNATADNYFPLDANYVTSWRSWTVGRRPDSRWAVIMTCTSSFTRSDNASARVAAAPTAHLLNLC